MSRTRGSAEPYGSMKHRQGVLQEISEKRDNFQRPKKTVQWMCYKTSEKFQIPTEILREFLSVSW